MLTPSETVKIQHSAIRGIGFLGDPKSAELIVPYLRSREPSLQLDAINALKDLKAVENIDSLLELTNASDDSVKQAAWEAIVAFLPSLSETQLANLQTTFHVRKQPDHELAVLEQQAKVFHARDDPQLADTLYNIGAAQIELGRWGEAAASLDDALKLRLQQQPPVASVILQPCRGPHARLLRARTTPRP